MGQQCAGRWSRAGQHRALGTAAKPLGERYPPAGLCPSLATPFGVPGPVAAASPPTTTPAVRPERLLRNAFRSADAALLRSAATRADRPTGPVVPRRIRPDPTDTTDGGRGWGLFTCSSNSRAAIRP